MDASMKAGRRRTLLTLTTGICSGWRGQAAAVETWQPRRQLEIVVPSAPGGGMDLMARTLQSVIQQNKLSSRPVSVLNRPGGGGTVSIAYMNAHGGDAHYTMTQGLPLLTNTITGLSPVGLADVTPLAILLTEQVMFSVAGGSPYKSGRDLIQQLRKDPASVAIAVSSSAGGQSHVAAALVLKAGGIDPRKMKIVFFDGGAEAVTALMGGHVGMTVTPANEVLGPMQSGRVRILAMPAATRQPRELADVPIWKEFGVDAEFSTWRAMVGPKGMVPTGVAWWDDVLRKTTATPEWHAAVEHHLWTAAYRDSAATRTFLQGEQKRLATLLTELGLAR